MFLRIFCAAFVVSSLFGGSGARHFRGGYVAWRPVEGEERQVKFYFRLAYQKPENEAGYCTQDLVDSKTPIKAKTDFIIDSADGTSRNLFGGEPYYTCQDVDLREDGWKSGSNETIITLPEQDSNVWVIWSHDCCWLPVENNPFSKQLGWLLRTTIDLTPRKDNDRVNSSPRMEGLTVRTVLRDCISSIKIATNDPDGDRVKCRWPESKDDCGNRTTCGNPDSSIFNWIEEHPCEITVNGMGAASGWYAVAVIVEDFLPEGYDGSEEPLSSISYQFLVNIIDEENVDCDRVTITPQSQCIAVPYQVFPPFRMILAAQTSKPSIPIVAINTPVSHEGMSKSELIDDGDGKYHVVLSYTPTSDTVNEVNILCYQAVDEQGIKSEPDCPKLFVNGSTPQAKPLPSTPTSNLSDPVNQLEQTWQLHFTERVQLNEEENSGTVTFLFMDGTVAHEVNISKDNLVTVSTEEPYFVSFTTPDFTLLAETNYIIRLAKGVVTGTEGCLVPSDPAEWQFITGQQGGTYTPDISVECTSTSMTAYIEKETVSINLPDFDPSILSFNDPECVGSKYNDSHIAVSTKYGKCGTEAIANEDSSRVSLINNIYIPTPGSFVYPEVGEPVLVRGWAYRIRVNCSIPSRRLAYVEFSTNPSTRDINEDVLAIPNFSLRMYQDNEYSKPFYSFGDFPIATDETQSDTLYFEARTYNRDRDFLPFLEECVATPRMVTSDSLQYPLIRNGCPLDPSVAFYDDAPPKRVRFSVEAFTFLGHNLPESIFVHCEMRDCNKRKGECEPTNCPEIALAAV